MYGCGLLKMADSVSISSTVSNTSGTLLQWLLPVICRLIVLSFDFNAQDIHCSCAEKIVRPRRVITRSTTLLGVVYRSGQRRRNYHCEVERKVRSPSVVVMRHEHWLTEVK